MAKTTNTRSARLDTPGRKTQLLPAPRLDQDTFGQFAEAFARYMGTAGFLFWMSLVIVVWIVWNVLGPSDARFDVYPFIFLTLALSLQASYAAPLILLAQNRQEARDRISVETDRKVAAQSRADMEFLAREIASVRTNIGEMATREFIRSELADLTEKIRAEVREEVVAELRETGELQSDAGTDRSARQPDHE